MERLRVLAKDLQPGEAFLVESRPNRFYLTGFNADSGFLLVTTDDAAFYTDSRYIEKAENTIRACDVHLSTRPTDEVAAFCKSHNIHTVYVETKSVSLRQFCAWKEALPSVTVSDDGRLDRLMTEQRQIKTPQELESMRQAQKMTDDAFAAVLNTLRAGRSERDVMLEMEFSLRKAGSEGVAFDFIVVSGANSSLPHGVPTDKLIAPGDFVTMDFGAVVNGYRSDMTRTVAISYADEEMQKIYQAVLDAQTSSMATIAPGVCCRDVDAVARRPLDEAYPGCFGHGLGHSVGIEIHENPAFNPRCDTILQPGIVMTVEPGVYIKGRYGVRIEDMVAVTDTGCENMTKSPKELLIIS